MGKIIGLGLPVLGELPAKKAKKGGGRPTKAELIARLEELGVEAPEGATNDVLGELLKAAEAPKGPEAAKEPVEAPAVVDEP